MIRSDRVLDPALQELKMTKRLRINKYKVDFAEFAVAWVISIKHESCEICKNYQNYVDGVNFNNFTSGYREPREISADCMHFA